MSSAPRVAVVGTSFGGRVHVPALRAAGFDVAALVGRDRVRTEARARDLGVAWPSTSLSEVLAEPGITCITVATPPHAHAAAVLDALRAGRHVLCEKPFARDGAEARAMVEAAEAAGVVALVGCEFRWTPEELLAARAIRSGAIGTPRVATLLLHSPLVAGGLHGAFNGEWWFDAASGGGILNAAGVHWIDRFRTWLGEVEAVSAVLQVCGDRPADEAEDTLTVLLRFASGCLGTIQHCAAARGPATRVCRVVGPRGSLWLDGADVHVADGTASRVLDAGPADLLPPPPPPSDDPTHAFTPLELPPYTRLAERFRALVEGRPAPDEPASPTFAEALRDQLVVDAVRASSAAGGQWVPVAG